ncbi:lysophospholipid acyltransferase family protein [Virgibacillus sp. LDC-1]|uniref:lysophospholipid acyltransferase family protein n=1 Tax=Virgibacillus sp. LDC-1 TaxID=3039856 RepID=UPI0024DE3198|nr:lysophospholipid acyltransferase family protein [Virgibacillus sp. LDC-1]
MYYFATYALKFLLSLFGRIKIYDKSNLPKREGYIIACTHTGWVDILWLGVAVLPTKIHYMAKKELFQTAFTKTLMKQLHAFPVDRANPGPSTIKIPRKLLAEGKVVGIFPSGTRTTENVPLKKGAVTIASSANAPIVPAAYKGPTNFKDLFQRKKPRIIFGTPIAPNNALSKKESIEAMMKELEAQFNALQMKIADK